VSCACEEVKKSQLVRLADVWLIGPLLIWAGWSGPKSRTMLNYALMGVGVGTILYNGRNFLENKKAEGKGVTVVPPATPPAGVTHGHAGDPTVAPNGQVIR
jgi:hypothetical protein